MTDAISVKDLEKEQEVLVKMLTEKKVAFYKAQKELNATKAEFSTFHDKYGRVLEMMKED